MAGLPLLFGQETEYGLTGLGADGQPVARGPLATRLVELARRGAATLHDATGRGAFLANGARFYVDSGSHPELATAECANPWDLVRCAVAGDRLLAALGARAEAESDPPLRVLLFRGSVDHGDQPVTWGCHESYLHRAHPSEAARQLLPHLASRVIYCGAGGFHPHRRLGFTLSPRAAHLVCDVASRSTRERGLVLQRDEPHAPRGYHRLHVLSGESLGSQTATLLKTGATALVLGLVDLGLAPGEAVQLHSAVGALGAFAADPWCRARAPLRWGGAASALQIQRHYLDLVERALAGGLLPRWGRPLCRIWAQVLDRLGEGPQRVERTVDWGIKLALFRRRCPRTAEWEWLTHACVPRELRTQLLEIDVRFGQLGGGVFDVLDRQGVLDHRVVPDAAVERAGRRPPAGTRARQRGYFVERLAGRPMGHCDWTGIWNGLGDLVIDLQDPFAGATGGAAAAGRDQGSRLLLQGATAGTNAAAPSWAAPVPFVGS
ncbi:MAG TPA: proteasome accessory factor PafA2 family protein [Thermoanaerobaculia bacterium]|nr:proteasome accessory factor PafA2 family protein [Thermoanaerobaculia bacterium]